MNTDKSYPHKFILEGDMDDPFDVAVSDVVRCAAGKSFPSGSNEYTELIHIVARALQLAAGMNKGK